MPARGSLIERLSDGVTVITATERLARELRRAFDQCQLARGKAAWESADVLPYHACLQRIWLGLSADAHDRPILLNPWQLVAAWADIIRDDIRAREREHDTDALWNTHASATSAVDAWRIVHAWNLDLAQCAQSGHRDHRCWLRWAEEFQRVCAARNWTDPYRLADRLCDLLGGIRSAAATHDPVDPAALPGQIAFSGFDSLLPQQQSLIDALQSAGVEVDIAAPDASVNQQVEARAFEDESSQWLSAARWAREKLLADPQTKVAKVAIVAPNLAKAAPAIEYALQQILCPQQLLEPATGANALPYHLSLGAKLIRHPVAHAALVALSPMAMAMAGKPLPLASVSQLMLSPFIRGADSEAVARCKLEARYRRRLPYQIRFKQFLKALSRDHDHAHSDNDHPDSEPHCPLLLDALSAASALLENNDRERARVQTAGHWARRFSEWLDHLGWPGERVLDSDEFQAARALRQELQNLATLDLVAPPLSALAAWSWLQRRAAEQPFQVEAHDAPVQVLGVVEAAGQRFDALWFGDLLEADWPPAQRPNPFIHIRLQREAGIFEASLEHNRARAERLQARLIASASGNEVVLSRPLRVDDDVEAEPSPLFECDGDSAHIADSQAALADTPANIMHRHQPEWERFIDTRAPAFAQGAVAGGIAVIENQAKCPFRAFALHRLGARDIEPNEQGLSGGERGSLIHRALQLAWDAIQSSEKLHALSGDELQAILRDAAEQAGRRYQVSSGCGERFHQTQTQWAVEVLSEWLEVEKQRDGAFVVSAREEATALRLSGLDLAFQIDRIDRMADGGLALIDYKTGAPDSLTNWGGERPQSPQLPLYAIAQSERVSTVAYARVKKGDCGFRGVTRNEPFAQSGVAPVENSLALKRDFDDWDALLAHWRRVLPQLAQEFVDGEARVDPLGPAICARCDLQGFCRVQSSNGDER